MDRSSRLAEETTRPRGPALEPEAHPGGTPALAAPWEAIVRLQREAGNASVAALLSDPEMSPIAGVVGLGGGAPLDAPTRAEMESSFGADFSDVRIHHDDAAATSARAVGARAYTVGSEIVLDAGAHDRRTMAHELAHVVQQRSGPVEGRPGPGGISVSDPDDRFERAAEETADRVISGRPAMEAGPGGPPEMTSATVSPGPLVAARTTISRDASTGAVSTDSGVGQGHGTQTAMPGTTELSTTERLMIEAALAAGAVSGMGLMLIAARGLASVAGVCVTVGIGGGLAAGVGLGGGFGLWFGPGGEMGAYGSVEGKAGLLLGASGTVQVGVLKKVSMLSGCCAMAGADGGEVVVGGAAAILSCIDLGPVVFEGILAEAGVGVGIPFELYVATQQTWASKGVR